MLCACSDDGNPEDGYLVIDESTIEIGNEGGSVTRYVSSNTRWNARSDCYWIHVSPSQGTGNNNISISVDANPNNTRREGYVYVYTQNGTIETHQLKVEQGSGSGTSSLGAPQNLKATVNGKSVNLTWNAVSGATKYHVYRMDTGSGYYNLISTVNTNSATDSNPLKDNYYKVKAANNSSESDFSGSVYASVSGSGNNDNGNDDNTPKKPETPTGLRARVNGSTVDVSWNASTGASYYRLYYTKPAPYDITSFDNIYSTSTTMNCTIKGTWTIWVQAVGANYESSGTSSKVTFTISSSGGDTGDDSGKKTKLDTPTGLTVNSRSTDSFVQLQCNAVSLGYDYQLYRSTSPNSGYSKINASVGSNASGSVIYFTDSNPKTGTTYYKVKVSALSYLGIKDSDYSDYVKVVR